MPASASFANDCNHSRKFTMPLSRSFKNLITSSSNCTISERALAPPLARPRRNCVNPSIVFRTAKAKSGKNSATVIFCAKSGAVEGGKSYPLKSPNSVLNVPSTHDFIPSPTTDLFISIFPSPSSIAT